MDSSASSPFVTPAGTPAVYSSPAFLSTRRHSGGKPQDRTPPPAYSSPRPGSYKRASEKYFPRVPFQVTYLVSLTSQISLEVPAEHCNIALFTSLRDAERKVRLIQAEWAFAQWTSLQYEKVEGSKEGCLALCGWGETGEGFVRIVVERVELMGVLEGQDEEEEPPALWEWDKGGIVDGESGKKDDDDDCASPISPRDQMSSSALFYMEKKAQDESRRQSHVSVHDTANEELEPDEADDELTPTDSVSEWSDEELPADFPLPPPDDAEEGTLRDRPSNDDELPPDLEDDNSIEHSNLNYIISSTHVDSTIMEITPIPLDEEQRFGIDLPAQDTTDVPIRIEEKLDSQIDRTSQDNANARTPLNEKQECSTNIALLVQDEPLTPIPLNEKQTLSIDVPAQDSNDSLKPLTKKEEDDTNLPTQETEDHTPMPMNEKQGANIDLTPQETAMSSDSTLVQSLSNTNDTPASTLESKEKFSYIDTSDLKGTNNDITTAKSRFFRRMKTRVGRVLLMC